MSLPYFLIKTSLETIVNEEIDINETNIVSIIDK